MLLLPGLVVAQSLERVAIASLGSSTVTTSTLQLSTTVGETCISSFSSTSLVLSEGFQQGTELPVALDELPDNFSLTVYPNPMGDQLSLRIESQSSMELEVTLWDGLGRETPVPSTRLEVHQYANRTIDCSQLAVGAYLLLIRDLESGQVRTVKVQKMN